MLRRHCLVPAVMALSLCAAAFAPPARAADVAVVQPRAASGFDAIELRGGIDLVVRQGPNESVQVSAPADVQARIEVRVDGKTLHIGVKKGESLRGAGPVTVTVEAQALRALSGSGSGDIRVGALKTPALALSLAGSGDARLDQLQTDALDIDIAGSGDVLAAGSASRLRLSIAGSGAVQASGLASDEVAIDIAGSGDAKVSAAKTLAVSIAGSGDVEYRGNAVLRSSVVGSGRVVRR